jgi:hypothetical protein
MRAYVTLNEISRLTNRDVRSIRRQFAEVEPAAILLAGSGVVALFDVGIAEHLTKTRMRPIQVQLQHTTGKKS